MKKIFIIGAVLFSFASCRNNNLASTTVPESVVTSFNQRYPQAENVDWEFDDNDGLYEAEFDQMGKRREAYYRPDGSLVRAE